MQPRMTRSILQTTAFRTRRVNITLPMVEALIDGVKYFRPGEELPPASGEELTPRPQRSARAAFKAWASLGK